MAVITIFPVFLLVLATVNGASLPTVPDCDEDGEFYKAGSVYKYVYVSNAESLAVGTTDRTTGLKLGCSVDLHAVGGCRYILKVPDCKLQEVPAPGTAKKMTEHPRSGELKELISKNQVSFTMTKGEVRDVIAQESEPLTVLNIKRGIMSTLQGSRKVADTDGEVRTDVHGTCPVKYSKDGDNIHMEVNMKHCHHPTRRNYQYSPWSLMYNMTFLQHFMMVSTLKCDYELSDSAVNKATCIERHAKRLYSHNNAELGVQTRITQTLQLKNAKADKTPFDRNLKNKRLTNIKYEYEPTPEPTGQPDNFDDRANHLMRDLVETSEVELRVFTVTIFDELVDLLRESNDVMGFVEGAYDCRFKGGCSDLENSLARNYLQDALVQCNSAPCLRGIRYLTTKDHMTSVYFNAMLFALTNVHVPNAAYVKELLEICREKPTRMCLLSLSSVIHTYSVRNREDLQSNVPDSIKEAVDLLSGLVGDDCNPDGVENHDLPRHERVEKTILALKAFGNLGAVAQQANNNIQRRLLSCAGNTNVPNNVTLEAIKALRRFPSTPQMYNGLMAILRGQKNPMENRIAAYVILAGHFPETKLFEDIVKVLKNEKTIQLGNFITMHLQAVVAANDPALTKLDKAAMEALSNHDDVFVIQGTRPMTSSRYRQFARYYNSPLLRDVINKFGIDINSGAAFESYSFLPQGLMVNLTTTLFGRTFNLATLGASLHGLEPVFEALFGPTGIFRETENVKDLMKQMQEGGEELLQKLTDPKADTTWVNHFDNDIEEKLNKIHNEVVHDYTSQTPSASIGFRLFGDELAFTSLDLIKDRIVNALGDILSNLNFDDRHDYYLTRVLRLLDGELIIPTIAGLPLSVGVDATLAVSFRVGGKANIAGLFNHPRSFSAEYTLNPSGALVVINKMELEVPHYACIGVRSNTTLHRSRQREGEINYEDGELNVHIKVPQRPQEVFSVYRANQLIRNHHFEDLPDHDINRIEKLQCHPDGYSGLKYCRYKSYADVTDKEKPWFPLAANAEYRLWFEKDDPDLTEYKYQIKRESAEDAPETTHIIHFEAPGSKWRREIHGVLTRKPETREFTLKVTVPEKPHFFIEGGRKQIIEDGEAVGYDTHFDAQFRPDRPISFDFVRKSKDGWDRKIMLKLPERQYTVTNVLRREGTHRVLDQKFEFESFVDHTYMHDILPETFWESGRKAYVKVHSNIEMDTLGENSFERNSDSTITTPKSVIELKTDRVRKPGQKRALNVYLTKKSLPSNEIQSFLNVNYNLDINQDGDKTKRHHTAKLRLPRFTYQLEVNREFDVADDNIEVEFHRTKYTPTDSSYENYYGEVENAAGKFQSKESEVKLKLKIHDDTKAKFGADVPAGEPLERTIDAELNYPRDNDQHNVKFHSHIIRDKEQQNAVVSFQHDYTLAISFWDLNFQGNTKYIRRTTDIKLDHDGKVTHVPTGNEGTYVVHLKSDIPMKNLDMQQTFHSPNFHFEQKVNGFRVQEGDGTEATFLSMNITSNSPKWDGLNADLTQIFYLHKDRSWEKMSFRHKLLDVDVKSDFKLPIGAHYNKEFHIHSKNKVLPNFNLHLHYHDYTMYTAHIEYPDEHRNVYAVGSVDPGYRGFNTEVSHDGPETQGNVTVAKFVLKIVSPHRIVTECDVDENALEKARETYRTRFAKTWDAWVEMKNDPNYPMNQLLKPYINADTLAEFQQRLRDRIQARREAVRGAIREALRSLRPFVESFITIAKNAANTIESKIYKFETDKPKTYTAWLWNYFEVTDLLQKYFENFRARVRGGLSDTRSGANIIDHPFTWNSLLELPKPSPRLARIAQMFRERVVQGGYRKSLLDRRRVATVFPGEKTLHVYTFDGASYQFPGFSNPNCMFLLGHDFAFRHFSILGQEGAIHFLFPELAVTMDRKGKVSLNGTKDAATLPYSSYNDRVKVTSEGNFINLKSRYGVDAHCSPTTGICLIYMDFWNHNKSLGLLGNNDNEASNDLKLMDGKVTENVHEFVSNYELSGRPVCVDKKRMGGKKQCGKGANPLCEKYFGKNNYRSPMYGCFDIVDPKAFLQACETDTDCGASSVCPAINAYVELCHARYVDLDTPVGCP